MPTILQTPFPTKLPTVFPSRLPTIIPTATHSGLPTVFPTPTPKVGCTPLPVATGTVTTSVTIGSTGLYTVWSRLLAPDANPASYYLQIDNNCPIQVLATSQTPSVWTWQNNYTDGISTNKILLNLTQGTHLIKLIGNTPNLGLDRIIFTSLTSCVPSGFGDNCNQASTPSAVVVPTSNPTPAPTVFSTPVPTSQPTSGITTVPTSSVSGIPQTPTPPIPTDTPFATPTPVPGTSFAVTVYLHGIGRGGDNVAPNSQGNGKPIHSQRTVGIEIYDSSNALVASPTGTVTFDPTSGSYKGVISVGQTLPAGAYIAKIDVPHHLNRSALQILTITTGEAEPIVLPPVYLIAGDITGQGKLSILDYNLILNCVSDLGPAKDCDPSIKDAADLNDDGVIDLYDLNLYFREISVQSGD